MCVEGREDCEYVSTNTTVSVNVCTYECILVNVCERV